MRRSDCQKRWAFLLLGLAACGGSSGGSDASPDAGDASDASVESAAGRCDERGVQSASTPLGSFDEEPMFESGLVMPENSIECTPASTGVPQTECNHHGSSIAELPDGTLAIAWFHGEAEKSVDSDVLWSRRALGAEEWTPPEVLVDDPEYAEGNPALWVAPEGTLYTFFVSIFGSEWPDARVRMITSEDNGQTWSDIVTLRDEPCWMARQNPLLFDDGELLLPLYNECAALPVFMRTSDRFEHVDYLWPDDELTSDYVLEHVGQIQPVLVAREDETIVAYTRDGSLVRRVHSMQSSDRGDTWTRSVPTDLPNSGTSIDAVRLENGHLALAFNNNPNGRFPLSVALSADEGRTFVRVRDINDSCDGENCKFAYPSILQASDATLWVSYTYDREAIGWAHFNEAWVAEGDEPSRVACPPRQACLGEHCYDACEFDNDCRYGETCADRACRLSCESNTDCCGIETCQSGLCEIPLGLVHCIEDGI